jgi:hypothetical protein
MRAGARRNAYRIHSLGAIINNLEIDSDYYAKATLYVAVYKQSAHYQALIPAQPNDQPKPRQEEEDTRPNNQPNPKQEEQDGAGDPVPVRGVCARWLDPPEVRV